MNIKGDWHSKRKGRLAMAAKFKVGDKVWIGWTNENGMPDVRSGEVVKGWALPDEVTVKFVLKTVNGVDRFCADVFKMRVVYRNEADALEAAIRDVQKSIRQRQQWHNKLAKRYGQLVDEEGRRETP